MAHHMSWFHRFEPLNKRDTATGVTAHSKLHYQPVDTRTYSNSLATADALRLNVAECVHRSFLTYNETLLACETCGSLVPASKLLLENEKLKAKGQVTSFFFFLGHKK